jgi:hypothetical protein
VASPPSVPTPAPPVLLTEARQLARQVLAASGQPPLDAHVEQLAQQLAHLLGAGWARGAHDLGRALLATSGLPAAMVDAMVQDAFRRLDQERARQ